MTLDGPEEWKKTFVHSILGEGGVATMHFE